jgi:hypothetical protein
MSSIGARNNGYSGNSIPAKFKTVNFAAKIIKKGYRKDYVIDERNFLNHG